MIRVDDDHVIETFSSGRANNALNISIMPRTIPSDLGGKRLEDAGDGRL